MVSDIHYRRQQMKRIREFESALEAELKSAMSEEGATSATVRDRLMPTIDQFADEWAGSVRSDFTAITISAVRRMDEMNP